MMISDHPLEININFTYNHIVNSVESLSFRHIKEEVREKILELFKDGHLPTSALYAYENELHLSITNKQELLEILADRTSNPNYHFVVKLFQQYHKTILGNRNGISMFKRLAAAVE